MIAVRPGEQYQSGPLHAWNDCPRDDLAFRDNKDMPLDFVAVFILFVVKGLQVALSFAKELSQELIHDSEEAEHANEEGEKLAGELKATIMLAT